MKMKRVIRSANNPCSPSELVASKVVLLANNIGRTDSLSELVVPVFSVCLVLPANTLKALPYTRGFCFSAGKGLCCCERSPLVRRKRRKSQSAHPQKVR